MRKFLKHIGFLFVVVVLILFILDLLYTKVYQGSMPRNKTQYIMSLSSKDSIDYVFLGSSRVENSIMASKVEKITGKRTVNLGTQAAKLADIRLFLELLIEQEVVLEKVFVQVDYIYNIESSSELVKSQSLPYIRSNKVIKEHLKEIDSMYMYNYYIPFYRYATNDYKIGFREFLAALINKKAVVNFEDGFVPNKFFTNKTLGATLPSSLIDSNMNFDAIEELRKSKQMDITYFCSPFCSNLKNEDYLFKLKNKIQNFQDYSDAVKDDTMFVNCSHLNINGANYFTYFLIKKLNL